MKGFLLIYLLSLTLGGATGNVEQSICTSSCDAIFDRIKFTTGQAKSTNNSSKVGVKLPKRLAALKVKCTNELNVLSSFSCWRQYCGKFEVTEAWKFRNDKCERTFGKSLPSIEKLQSKLLALPSQSDSQLTLKMLHDKSGKAKPYKTIVGASREAFNSAQATLISMKRVKATRIRYGIAMIYFWGGVVTVGIISRILGLLHVWSMAPFQRNYQNTKFGRIVSWFRIYISVGILTRKSRQRLGWFTFPTILESATILAFLMINIFLSSIHHEALSNNLYAPIKRDQIIRQIADRTGVLAIANLPILWVFGTRNNFALWLTNWNFSTLNVFHRWVARICTIEAIVHALGYTIGVIQRKGRQAYIINWRKRYWWCGGMALVAMCTICTMSIYPLRKQKYEIFLILHIALSMIVLPGIWYHVKIFDGEYNVCILPCVIVWMVDRLVRVMRVMIVNFTTPYSVTMYDSQADVIRVDKKVTRITNVKPGQYYFIHFVNGMAWWWENHPFSVSGWRRGGEKTLRFIIRPRNGITKRVKGMINEGNEDQSEAAWKSGSLTKKIIVLLDGPYSFSNDLSRSEAILFIANGTGITPILSHMQYICEKVTKTNVKYIQIVWCVREKELYKDVFEEEFRWIFSQTQYRSRIESCLDVYLAGEGYNNQEMNGIITSIPEETIEMECPVGEYIDTISFSSYEKNKCLTNKPNEYSENVKKARLRVWKRRPSVREVMKRSVESIVRRSENYQTMSIVSCGSEEMVNECRLEMVEIYRNHFHWIDFRPELNHW